MAGFPDLRLLWPLRRPFCFTGRLLASVSRGLSRSCRWTTAESFRRRLSRDPSRSLRNPGRRRGSSGRSAGPCRPANTKLAGRGDLSRGHYDSIQPLSPIRREATQGRGSCRRLNQPGTGVPFPVGLNPLRLNSPCDSSAKPRILAACVAPHGYLSGAAVSPRVCIRPQLRPNDSPPACTGGGGTGGVLPPFPHSTVTLRDARPLRNLGDASG